MNADRRLKEEAEEWRALREEIASGVTTVKNVFRGMKQSAGDLSNIITDIRSDYKQLSKETSEFKTHLAIIKGDLKTKIDDTEARKLIKEEMHEHRDSCPGRPVRTDYLKVLKIIGLIGTGFGTGIAAFAAIFSR